MWVEREISGGKNNSVLSEREIGMKLRKAFILEYADFGKNYYCEYIA